ncbi:hypothetical protein [Flavobacterium sp. UBA2787]|uniref:hypothetical protein n=1 Tax=Flavobacterium sp. UBA2787 TaxID=1946543 RepID=UPI0025BDE4E6|nr:hypothetical protein [Flavobacterium sp. UBA2787]
MSNLLIHSQEESLHYLVIPTKEESHHHLVIPTQEESHYKNTIIPKWNSELYLRILQNIYCGILLYAVH